MPRCALCGRVCPPEDLDYLDRPDGGAVPICGGCLRGPVPGDALPWEDDWQWTWGQEPANDNDCDAGAHEWIGPERGGG